MASGSHEDMHAGELEVSILLAAFPDVVRDGWDHDDHTVDDRRHLSILGHVGLHQIRSHWSAIAGHRRRRAEPPSTTSSVPLSTSWEFLMRPPTRDRAAQSAPLPAPPTPSRAGVNRRSSSSDANGHHRLGDGSNLLYLRQGTGRRRRRPGGGNAFRRHGTSTRTDAAFRPQHPRPYGQPLAADASQLVEGHDVDEVRTVGSLLGDGETDGGGLALVARVGLRADGLPPPGLACRS